MNAHRGGAVIVGAGLMGRWHADTLRAIGQRVSTIVDADARRAAALALSHRADSTTDLGAALARGPSAVHVCTPAESHLAIASTALSAGAHVLVEKPFAPTPEATESILQLADARRLVACPVHQFLFQRGVRQAVARLADFGPVLHADFIACSAGAEGAGGQDDQRRRLALDILPHPLSLLRRLGVEPLSTVTWYVQSLSPGEVRVSGAGGRMSISILISSRGRPTRNTARLIGEHGTAHLDLFHGFATFEAPGVSRVHKAARPFRVGTSMLVAAGANIARRLVEREMAYPGLRDLVKAFYAAIATGGAPPISPEETKDVASSAAALAALLSPT